MEWAPKWLGSTRAKYKEGKCTQVKKTNYSLNLELLKNNTVQNTSQQCTANTSYNRIVSLPCSWIMHHASYNQKGHFWGLQTSEYKCCVQSKRALLGTPNIRVVVLCTIKKGTFGDLDPTDSEQACDHLWSASSITIDILLIFDDAIISHCQTDHIQRSNDDKATSES